MLFKILFIFSQRSYSKGDDDKIMLKNVIKLYQNERKIIRLEYFLNLFSCFSIDVRNLLKSVIQLKILENEIRSAKTTTLELDLR